MGYVFRRSKGRAWRLRARSMQLWPKWIEKLSNKSVPFELQNPLLQLASSKEEASFMEALAKDRKKFGLEMVPAQTKKQFQTPWPNNKYGGLLSYQDGRIDPIKLQKNLKYVLNELKVTEINQKIISLERGSSKPENRWRVHLKNGVNMSFDTVIICAALGAQDLLQPLGHNYQIEPVLGQALELHLNSPEEDLSKWPGVLISQGVNFIPTGKDRLLLGATIEHGNIPNNLTLKQMKNMNGFAPDWLKQASINSHWYGLRGRPVNHPAPLLNNLEPGLILATGHYRNGILLAPVTAEWVGEQISKEDG